MVLENPVWYKHQQAQQLYTNTGKNKTGNEFFLFVRQHNTDKETKQWEKYKYGNISLHKTSSNGIHVNFHGSMKPDLSVLRLLVKLWQWGGNAQIFPFQE